MESKCFDGEKSSNSKNISYFEVRAEIGEEGLPSRITTSNSTHTNFQDLGMFNTPKRSKSVSLESLAHEPIKVCTRSSSLNKAHDVIAKHCNAPQFRKLPLNICSRIGAVQVLPTCNIRRNVKQNCHKPHFDSGIILVDKYDQCETEIGHNGNTNASNAIAICDLNSSMSENCAISEIISPNQDIQCMLNKEICTLRPLENNAIAVASSETLQLENSVQNSILTVTSDYDAQIVGKQGKDEIKSPREIANINFTHLEIQETPITSDINDKYLDYRVDNEPKITISPEVRYLLSGKNKNSKIVSEPLYEEIEESDKQNKTENHEQILTSLKDGDKEHFRRSINDPRRQLESDEESEQQRFERLSSKGTNTFDEAFKIEVSQLKNEKSEKDIDEIWIKYMDRPLLPLKTNLKQRSSSCTNLVQSLKVFSKRNSADNNRSVELIGRNLKHTKNIFNSEADISKNSLTEESQLEGIQPPRKTSIAESLETRNYPWYHPVDAREASKRLLDMEQDGVFLIRPASNPTKHISHTLCVTYNGCVYNMYIRHLENGCIALGKRKENEKTFSCVLEMIRYHQSTPISISMVQCNTGAYVYLLITPPK